MNKLFAASLAIIGGVLGFIIGLTIGFAMNSYSLIVLYGLATVFALFGGFSLSKFSSAIDNQDQNTRKVLIILCTIIAAILLALLILTVTMLNTYY
ncbi:hypothetical protein DKL61_14805 [Gammaproteobacteria bacterium ESL0073]|uniref:Uncharacterized protein n=1 Tax=Entomomonas moraniae TaxID=2213226 RepID=A0A451EPD7_9GAMM|nr:hypothetical protein [Entomomonas moraniae]AWM81502.1 hypothetical protein DKL61_14805 [Gammaproteobacteria bacterium ESL0073]AZS51662.1 hypothetical protein DM558_13170 [Entomomonas moraniae]